MSYYSGFSKIPIKCQNSLNLAFLVKNPTKHRNLMRNHSVKVSFGPVWFSFGTNPIASRDLSLQPASMMDAYILVATIVFGLLSRPLQADVPRCDKDSPDFTKSPYCLPVTYNKDLIPPTDGPLNINVDIFVFEVQLFLLV